MSREATNLTVFVDGVIYSYQKNGGISRILNEVLPRVCALRHDLSVQLWTWQHLAQPIPESKQIERGIVNGIGFPRASRPALLSRLAREARGALNGAIRHATVAMRQSPLWHATLYWRPRFWKGRSVTTVYDLKEELFPELSAGKRHILRFKRDSINHADRIICISETTKNDVVDFYGVPADRIDIVYPAVDHGFWRPIEEQQQPTNASQKPFVLYVGRRDRFKDFDCVLEGFRQWPRHADFRLLVAGPELTTQERSRIQQLKLTDSVECSSDRSDLELLKLYRSAAALVYPSKYEGFGLPILEAMACGCPVIASRIPTSQEVAGQAALFFETGQPEDLAAVLEESVSDGCASERVHAGLTKSAFYNWDSSAQALLSSYLRTLNQVA